MKSKRLEYEANPKLCLQCSKALTHEDAIRKRKKFCNSSCSATYSNTKRVRTVESKERIKQSHKQLYERMYASFVGPRLPPNVRRRLTSYSEQKCNQCSKMYQPWLPKQQFCGVECVTAWRSSPEQTEHRRQLALKRVADGTHSGWQSRKNRPPSYPEKYFIGLFEKEGILVEREVKCGRFFIDFVYAKKLAIEIDGKQHTYPDHVERDKRKDTFLESQGYKVFRIAWSNPKNDAGKAVLYPQIEKLKEIINQM